MFLSNRYISGRASSLSIYSMEDAAVGIWLNSVPLPVKAIYGDGYMYRRECPPGNSYYFVNPVTPAEMDVIYDKYKQHDDICGNNFALSVCSSKDRFVVGMVVQMVWDGGDMVVTEFGRWVASPINLN